jgi:anaerobic C4-dicarboxylate transporter
MKLYLVRNPLQFFLGASAFAWALSFVRYLGHWVLFPTFPNILDSIGMALIGTYLLYHAFMGPGAEDNAISRARFQFLTERVQDGTATSNEESEFMTLRREFFRE